MPNTIGDNIRRKREAAGLTQVQAAERMGCQQPWWSALECDRKGMSLSTLQRVAKALGCRAVELFSNEKEKP